MGLLLDLREVEENTDLVKKNMNFNLGTLSLN